MNVGFKRFNWLPMPSAWKQMESQRARRAEFMQQDQANLDAVNNAFTNASQNRISQSANLSATAVLKRVRAAAKAKNDEALKQIDEAQKALSQATVDVKV